MVMDCGLVQKLLTRMTNTVAKRKDMKKIVVLLMLSMGSLFGYEIADSFQYPVSSNELYQNSNSSPKKG